MNIAVVGMGKIGLPLAVQYAKKGHRVTGVDINSVLVGDVNAGSEPFPGESHLGEYLPDVVNHGLLRATTAYSEAIPTAEAVVVVVPLFVDDESWEPDFGPMESATADIARYLTAETLVVYETTLPVGTTRSRWKPALENGSGLVEGRDFYLAFSPERVLTGRVFADLRKYPKLIGALSLEGAARARAFYEAVLEFDPRPDLTRGNGVWDLGSAEAAEMAKLAETTYRDVNIALANQFALFAETHGIDVHAVIEASNSQPYSHIHQPGIAVGGHCIPVYPRLYLFNDPDATVVRAAREANASMPERVVSRLEEQYGTLAGARVAVLGASYRGGVKETAFSGVFPTVRALERRGATAVVHDPMFSDAELKSLGLLPYHVGERLDAAIVQADHPEYGSLTPEELPGLRVMVDGRRALDSTMWPSGTHGGDSGPSRSARPSPETCQPAVLAPGSDPTSLEALKREVLWGYTGTVGSGRVPRGRQERDSRACSPQCSCSAVAQALRARKEVRLVVTPRPKRILMIADRTIYTSSRVKKMADTAARAGYDVVVVDALASIQGTEVSAIGHATARAVPLRRTIPTIYAADHWLVQRIGFATPADCLAAVEASSQFRAERRAAADRRKSAGRSGLRGLRDATSVVVVRGRNQARSRAEQLLTLLAASPAAKSGYPGVRGRISRSVARAAPTAYWYPLLPDARNFTNTLLDELGRVEVDLIHAHDYISLPVAERLRSLARKAGKETKILYDAHEWLTDSESLVGEDAIRAIRSIEQRGISSADAVITVNPAIARLLADRYSDIRLPTVVTNAPMLGQRSGPTLRERIGIRSSSNPVLIYSGTTGPERELSLCVEALVDIPSAHLALVVDDPLRPSVRALREHAQRMGVGSRMHITRYVEFDEVVDFMRDADVGLLPLKRSPNTDLAIATKLREYLLAGLPVVASDAPAQEKYIKSHGVGIVYQAGNAASLGSAIREALNRSEEIRRSIAQQGFEVREAWDQQAERLLGTYRELIGPAEPPADVRRGDTEGLSRSASLLPGVSTASASRLIIGSENSAGQGWAWSRAASTLRGVEAHNVAIANRFMYDADLLVNGFPSPSPAWIARLRDEISKTRTHVLIEACSTIVERSRNPSALLREVRHYERAGLKVGMIIHGSELRSPEWHESRFSWSAFKYMDVEERNQLVRKTRRTGRLLEWLGLPVFVATLDLMPHIESQGVEATWLPITIDPEEFANSRPVLSRGKLRVLHAPSRASRKGSQIIDPILTSLHDQGVIDYRRVSGVPHSQMAREIIESDVVVDQLGLGIYATLAIESMAAGRLVVSQVGPEIRDRMEHDVPIVEVTADTLKSEILSIVDHPESYIDVAESGPNFAKQFHDGRAAADALSGFLGVSEGT